MGNTQNKEELSSFDSLYYGILLRLFKRLFENLQSFYSKEFMVFVFDALYACGPIIKLIIAQTRWNYIIAIKPKGNKALFTQFNARDKRGQVH